MIKVKILPSNNYGIDVSKITVNEFVLDETRPFGYNILGKHLTAANAHSANDVRTGTTWTPEQVYCFRKQHCEVL